MKTAIVLFNLGGPDSLEAVRPFLYNLFSDPAILRLKSPFRQMLAWLLAKRREETAQEIYMRIGGKSPILENTQEQAHALERYLAARASFDRSLMGREYKCFIAMRYWHPLTEESVEEVKAYAPDDIVLLPLYPQFSTTTTASSLKEWQEKAFLAGLSEPTKTIGCYPVDPSFIETLAALTRAAYEEASHYGKPRILLSAHGLPQKIVKAGDPYQWQCEQSAAALIRALDIPHLDWTLCYQSRVGPLKWIGPATDAEVKRAGKDQVPLVVVPISFVSEHSETLVELDLEYRALAEAEGVPFYAYVPTVSSSPTLISGLARLIFAAQNDPQLIKPGDAKYLCPKEFSGCICR